MYHGECEGSYPSDEACTFCRSPGGEAESVSSEQGFSQTVVQAARNDYQPNIVDEEVPPGVCRIVVSQCWQQRAFARWGWAQDRLNPFVHLVLYACQYTSLCGYWVVHRAFIDLVLGFGCAWRSNPCWTHIRSACPKARKSLKSAIV